MLRKWLLEVWKINGLENIISIVRSDLKDLEFENNSFDVVITNPPYKKAGTGIDNKNEKQKISRYETTANLDEVKNCFKAT